MKKKEKIIAVNNQEDEDGYTLYPGYAVYKGNINDKQIVSALHKAAHPDRYSSKKDAGNLTSSAIKKHAGNKR